MSYASHPPSRLSEDQGLICPQLSCHVWVLCCEKGSVGPKAGDPAEEVRDLSSTTLGHLVRLLGFLGDRPALDLEIVSDEVSHMHEL